MLAAQVADDRLVHPVATNADRARINNVAQRQNRNLGGAAANIDNHVAGGVCDRHSGTNRRRNRFGNQSRTPRTGGQNRGADCTLFNRGRAVGHTNNDLGFAECRAFVHLADEMFDHLFGTVEIGNHPLAHRPDRLDAARGATQHQLGVFAYGQHLFYAILDVIGDHRRFVQNNALAFDVDQRVRRAQINCHVGRKQTW